MADTERKSGPRGPYRHLIGGETRAGAHEPGDKVDPSTPPNKIKEWLRAGIIESERPQRAERKST